MRFFFILSGTLFFFLHSLFAGNSAPVPSRARTTDAAPAAEALFDFPLNSANILHFVKKDSADSLTGAYPVWQKKVSPQQRSFFKIKKRSNLRPLLKPGLIFGTIAFNWASFYLKRQADDHYRDYQRTSSIRRMNASYKKCALYDDLAAFSLGLAAASLSAFMYILWTE